MALLLVWALLRGNSLVIVTRAWSVAPFMWYSHVSVLFLSFPFFSFPFFFWVIGRLSVLFRIDSPIAIHLMKLRVTRWTL
jgi:hypothetical protein